MKELQKAANDALISTSGQKKIDSLARAFEIFSHETARLEAAYDQLNDQFVSLNMELQETNGKLQSKVAELDLVANYLRGILDNIAQGILFVDLSGTVTTCNHAAETILGIPSKKIVFNRFDSVFSDDIFGFSMSAALSKSEAFTNYSIGYTNPKGIHSELEVAITFTHQKIDLSKMQQSTVSPYHQQGMIVMIRDVTEIRHLQTEAARNDRMKMLGEIAAQVAHEIRNPLGGIKGFGALLKRDLVNHPEMQQMAGYIVDGTDHLNNLVNQILSFSRPVQAHVEKTDLVSLVEETKQHIMADPNTSADGREISITIDSSSEKLPLLLDPPLIKSALLNLLVNAVQAMPKGGEILITIRENSKHVILSISDTGTGISEENVGKLYTLFFTTKHEGNGLGLVETQKVIQAHGGSIDVSSTEGKGTTFIIKFSKRTSAEAH